MPRHARPDPKAIALWRYEQIEEALASPKGEVRAELLRRRSRAPVVHPGGATRRVSVATLYRWIALYEPGDLEALRPRRRRDAGRPRAPVPADVVRQAIALLADDPDMTLTFLLTVLQADPSLRLRERAIVLARSTLARRLAADPGWARLKRARRQAKRRTRYVARHVHDIWHLDAKGPVTIRLADGATFVFHVLTVLEDVSRAVLAAVVAPSPDLGAAVRVLRQAARRWGLPDRMYADRASIFDSHAFRSGLAQLGVHRIFVKSRNPEANGKIEAYHRTLALWFFKRLARQKVVDPQHLQHLLEAVVETLYQDHRHRGLACSPRRALADRLSPRRVGDPRLDDAFRQERTLKAHPKTGEVDLPDGTWLVPDALRGRRLVFLLDPEKAVAPLVVDPGTARALPLTRAAVREGDRGAEAPPVHRWGEGALQVLLDAWQGNVRPVAEPGFGLPEILALLSDAAGRPVPRSDAEAALVQQAWRRIGPLPRRATEDAMAQVRRALGRGRPLQAYLDALAGRVRKPPQSKTTRTRSRP